LAWLTDPVQKIEGVKLTITKIGKISALHRLLHTLLLSFAALLSGYASAMPSINANVISWPDDGWYQVLSADDFSSVCEGGSSCQVANGMGLV